MDVRLKDESEQGGPWIWILDHREWFNIDKKCKQQLKIKKWFCRIFLKIIKPLLGSLPKRIASKHFHLPFIYPKVKKSNKQWSVCLISKRKLKIYDSMTRNNCLIWIPTHFMFVFLSPDHLLCGLKLFPCILYLLDQTVNNFNIPPSTWNSRCWINV